MSRESCECDLPKTTGRTGVVEWTGISRHMVKGMHAKSKGICSGKRAGQEVLSSQYLCFLAHLSSL